MLWARLLAYVTGTVNQEFLLRNEYLSTLAEIAQRLRRRALEELAAVAKPDTLLAWYRRLIVNKFDGSKYRKSWGRPRVDEETERLVVRMAKENPGMLPFLAFLGHNAVYLLVCFLCFCWRKR
jgi:putative transposase